MTQHARRSFVSLVVAMILWTTWAGPVKAQLRAGASFLSALPGARSQAMAASQTGALDEVYALYANPGATGFLRERQWAVTYTKWIADVYRASLLYGRRLPNALSRDTRLAVGILYQGVPEFDSSDRAAANASANDLVVSLSLGQPLWTYHLSAGANLKYLRSRLDHYVASTAALDIGLTARTRRFNLGNPIFEHAILSAGVALTQLGAGLQFANATTPLPRTLRAGVGFYLGTHKGFQLQLHGDYQRIRDEGAGFRLGGAMSWGQIVSLNSGYNFNSDLMGHASFGVTICLDDITTSERAILPGRNNALGFNFATLNEGEFFSRTYQGEVTHYPVGPESFRFLEPGLDDSLSVRNPVLRWEASRDPDLYDDVTYTVLLDRDSTKLGELANTYETEGTAPFLNALSDTTFWLKSETPSESLRVANLPGGHYYWMVIASDRDGHLRLAERGHRRVWHFYVRLPDIEIQDLQFRYSPWITQDDYQGELVITIANKSDLLATDFSITVYDSVAGSTLELTRGANAAPPVTALVDERIDSLEPGESRVISLPWHTARLGPHQIVAVADREGKEEESDKTNNVLSRRFYTIPKGTFAVDDSARLLRVSQVSVDLPVITEICFDQNSAVVKPEYLHKTIFDPPLSVLAKRLAAHRDLAVTLQGFSDPNSGETSVDLADRRAEAVRDSLIEMGVRPEQIHLLPGKVLPPRRVPSNPQDARWVLEERRHVQITSDKRGEEVLFRPMRHTDKEIIFKPLVFQTMIKFAVPAAQSWIACFTGSSRDSLPLGNLDAKKAVEGEFQWNFVGDDDNSPWLEKPVSYYFSVEDTLGRRFRTHDRGLYIVRNVFDREHRIVFPLKFALADPVYSFIWSRAYDQAKYFLSDPMKRMFFEGHACAIGPASVNLRLSRQRARRFHDAFVKYLKSEHPEDAAELLKRLDPPRAYGESRPLAIVRLNGQVILLGDNNQALGRKLNRRIELVFTAEKGQ